MSIEDKKTKANASIAALSVAELSQRLLAIGIAAGLVTALADNGVDGVRFLNLTDDEFQNMGVHMDVSREALQQNLMDDELSRIDPEAGLAAAGESDSKEPDSYYNKHH
ncbi:hypothetical protein HDU96_009079 [Phlyctochytrium bullatum]|nr:hypothetical protein HDU96_009079 [Phlyctochytrium bullatum]